jgi:hypothetical protein
MVLIPKRAAVVALILITQAASVAAQRGNSPLGEARPLLYGFALECIDCTPGAGARGRVGGGGRSAAPAVMSYRSFPLVRAVAPGTAAERVGIRAGDILQSIDGMSLLTERGAERFAHATKGEQVRLGFRRDGKPITVDLPLGAAAGQADGPVKMIRGYNVMHGRTTDAEISLEIWSDDPIFMRDSVGTIVLTMGTAIVKFRVKQISDSTGAASGRGRKPEPIP